MSETTNVLTNEQRVKLVQDQKKQEAFRNTMLSISGVLLFFVIWEILALSGIVDRKKICDVLEIFQLFIVKFTESGRCGPSGQCMVQSGDCALRFWACNRNRHSAWMADGMVPRI